MIKMLQRKFIMTAMTAITCLLILLLGAINVVNAWASEKQSGQLLCWIMEKESFAFPKPGPMDWQHGFFAPPMTEDTAMTAVYFVVRTDSEGEITHVDLSRIASIKKATAIDYVKRVEKENKTSGKIDHFKYKVTKAKNGPDQIYVFMDTSLQRYSVIRVLALSGGLGIVCWGIMLAIIAFLSKRAIAPIAQNMEKQKQFVTDAGHEIKTPLAIILANTDAMELCTGENKWSKNIRNQTLRLNGLMQNLLTLAKMEETNSKLVMEDINLSSLLEEVLGLFEETRKQKQISLTTEISKDMMLHANKENIQRLFSILVDNAVKYTPNGGGIVVVLRTRDKKKEILIRNTCEQVPNIAPEKMFDRFYRGDSARTQKTGGYGIGLSAAKAIVEQQNGTIEAKYVEKDRVEFVVRL